LGSASDLVEVVTVLPAMDLVEVATGTVVEGKIPA
jgi:hypothetical protein